MKNPFQKEDHTGLIVGITAGAAIGISLAWLFLTDKGAECRRKLKEQLSDTAADLIDKKTFIPKKLAKLGTDAAIKECSPVAWPLH